MSISLTEQWTVMAVKGRQAKLKNPHDTTRVVDVSCASVSSVQSSICEHLR